MTINMPDAFAEMLAELSLDADALEVMARAFDKEEASQCGEPDPWASELVSGDQEWREERMCCALCALEALGAYWQSLDRKAAP